jgi:hypothetical protein
MPLGSASRVASTCAAEPKFGVCQSTNSSGICALIFFDLAGGELRESRALERRDGQEVIDGLRGWSHTEHVDLFERQFL